MIPIPSYEGLYSISKDSTIISHDRIVDIAPGRQQPNGYKAIRRGRTMRPHHHINGYVYVTLCKNGKKEVFRLHRLVLMVFVGPSDLECNHKNGNKSDNRLCNLEYVTRSENMKHAYDTGLNAGPVGSKCGAAKLNEKQVLELRRLFETGEYSQVKLGKMFGLGRSAVNQIVHRKRWKHI